MGFRLLSPKALHDRLREHTPCILIDTLMDDHFRAVHLPGAINVCVYEVIFLDNIARLIPGKDQEIVVYGSSDKSLDALTAAEKLTSVGYQRVSVLDKGLAGWRASGYKLEGEDVGILERVEPAWPSADTSYAVDCEQSFIHWFGRNRTTTHHGTLQLSSGEIAMRDGLVSGAFDIDMTSIRNIDLEGDPLQPNLLGHLMSEDFFYTRMFPRATFTITTAQQVEEVPSSLPNFQVQGILELRGLTNDLDFLATVSPLQEGEIKIEAHFDIDRTRWAVLYGSSRFFEHLGYHLVYNLISLHIRLAARIMT